MQAMTVSLFATLLVASAWAVREDVLAHRIPNRLTGSLLVTGLVLQLNFAGWSGLGEAALGVLVGLGMLLPLYVMRATGAGDVKLLAALGALLGPYWAALAGVYTLLVGGVLAGGYVLAGAASAAITPTGMSWPIRLQRAWGRAHDLRRERFPYALAIALGALGAAAERGDLRVVIDYLGLH